MKILLVSDIAQFALTDVYYGYLHAFQKLGVDVVGFPLHHFVNHHKENMCLSMVHSQALIKANQYTHVFFIGGLSIPPEFLESFPGIKVGVISTEDPHSFDPLRDRLSFMDYYFTNERSVVSSENNPKVHYCPTAADHTVCGSVPRAHLDSKYLCDILFLGAIYPNRRKFLEGIIPWVKENNLHLKIIGHPQYVPKESPIWNFVSPENYDPRTGSIITIPHEETVKYYNGAKVSLNFFRDVTWSPARADQKNDLNKNNIVAESMNPRAYEVPLCGGFLMMEDTRKEAREFYKEDQVSFFTNVSSLKKQLKKYLLGENSEQLREAMTQRAFMRVTTHGTYMIRAKEILRIIS